MKHETWKNIDSRMFDFAHFYDKMVAELPNDAVIVEVGVADGCSAIYLAEAMANAGKNFKLYMVDNMAYGGAEQLNTIIRNVMRSGLAESIEILPLSSIDACCKFNDNSVHLVFLDSSHTYEMTKQEARCWYKKLSHGSILAGHDYFSDENPGVKQAIDEVIPAVITRDPIVGQQTFEPENALFNEGTTKGHGVWFVRSRHYLKLN